jgi:hypothetical protein
MYVHVYPDIVHAKCLICLADFNQIWSFSIDLVEVPIPSFTKILPVGAAMLHADRQQTDGETRRNYNTCDRKLGNY